MLEVIRTKLYTIWYNRVIVEVSKNALKNKLFRSEKKEHCTKLQ